MNMEMEKELDCLREQNAALKRLLLKALEFRSNAKLDELPKSLQDDRDFVFSVVKSGAIDWVDIPDQWKDDVEIVCAAFGRVKRNPIITRPDLDYDDDEELFLDMLSDPDPEPDDPMYQPFLKMISEPSVCWCDLPYDMRTKEEVVHHALQARNGPQWKQIPYQLRSNTEILFTALRYGKVSFARVPDDLKRMDPDFAIYGVQHGFLRLDECPCVDQDLIKEKVRRGELSWTHLPSSLRYDVDFARSFHPSTTDSTLIIEILVHVEQLRHDRTYWHELLRSSMEEKKKNRIIMTILPPRFFIDKGFMIDVCSICADAFEHVLEGGLGNDAEFLEAVLSQNASLLKSLPRDIQQRHRDLIIRTLPRFAMTDDPTEIESLTKRLRPVFWFQRDFAFAWAKSGLGFPRHAKRTVRNTWSKIRDLCLEIAIRSKSLEWAENFTDDLPFMLKVLEYHPELYVEARGSVRSDPWAMTLAFAGCQQTANDALVDLRIEGKYYDIECFLKYLRGQLEPFENFRDLILGSMLSTQIVEETGTALTLLNQGPETSAMYKREIAAYLGLTTGKRLCRLQQAEQNALKAVV